jgi:hypothetical protein
VLGLWACIIMPGLQTCISVLSHRLVNLPSASYLTSLSRRVLVTKEG